VIGYPVGSLCVLLGLGNHFGMASQGTTLRKQEGIPLWARQLTGAGTLPIMSTVG